MRFFNQLAYIIIVFSNVYSIKGYAQVSFEWAEKMDGSGYDAGSSSCIDSLGFVYVTGHFESIVDFDPGPGVYNLSAVGGTYNIYIQKLDPAGNLVWVKNLGRGYGGEINIDNWGNICISGEFSGTNDFDPGPGIASLTSNGGTDIFIARYSSDGDYQWAKGFGGTEYEHRGGSVVDNSGNIYATGYFKLTADFDPGPSTYNLTANATSSDIFIWKLDSSGNFLYAKSIGSSGIDNGSGIKLDPFGNLYVTGYFEGPGTIDFDPGLGVSNLTGNGFSNAFVLKLNATGNFTWARSVGSTGCATRGYGIGVDDMGNVSIGGEYTGTVDFNPSAGTYNLTSNGIYDAFILKLNSAGNFAWAKSIGGANSDIVFSIDIDDDANTFMAGRFYGQVDLDPGPGTNLLGAPSTNSVFIDKLDLNGNFNWARHLQGNASIIGSNLRLDSTRIYVTGGFYGTIDLNPGPDTSQFTVTNSSGYLVKLNQCTEIEQLIETACDSFVAHNTVYVTSGLYNSVFSNLTDCDTAFSLDLTILNSSSYNFSASACSSYTLNSQTYLTSGIYNQFFTNSAGCDSVVTVDLSINNSSSTINQFACDSFVFQGQTYHTTGSYFQTIPNHLGCDSAVTINLTVSHNSVGPTINADTCDSYTINSQTYTTTGTYVQYLPNGLGCDSIITLNLSIPHSSSITMNVDACTDYTLNSVIYTNSGIYDQILVNSVGCDSAIHLNLTINGTHPMITQTGIQLSSTLADTYQWINCSTGNDIIPGANSDNYTPTEDGSYAVIVTQNGCTDTSDCSAFIIIGIEENVLENIQVYPNPTSGKIYLDRGEIEGEILIEVYNMLGQKVHSKTWNSTKKIDLDIAGNDGVYFIALSNQYSKAMYKIMKE